jgi:3-methyladenine DNA glycosylase AlkC
VPNEPRDPERRLFKHEVNAETIAALGSAVAELDPAFDAAGFRAVAGAGLEPLELKARVAHVAAALDAHLQHRTFAETADLLATAVEQLQQGMWTAWPTTTLIGNRSLEDPDAAIGALGRITRYSSAEFALRPLLHAQPEPTLAHLHMWAASDDLHLRRAASESSRPRLPWGQRLPRFIEDPTQVIALLDGLHADPEEYVRRSAANNLNDISKDHPALAVATAQRWLEDGGDASSWTVRHALRGLVKAGDPAALGVLGFDAEAPVAVTDLTIATPVVEVGGALELAFTLTNPTDQPVPVVVDYVVHHRKANGATSPKVFKLRTRTLAARETVAVNKRHPMRPITTRTYYSGEHRVEVQVNGSVRAGAPFQLLVP